MAVTAETISVDSHTFVSLERDFNNPEVIPEEERVLLNVDYLLNRRLADGSYTDGTLEAVHTNLLTATKEMAIPHAISTIYMDRVSEGIYLFNDKTSIEVAQSGYRYHHHPAARERVAVEVAEAEKAATLVSSKLQVFISPRMTEADAPRDIAEREHLAHDDALRVTGISSDEQSRPGDMAMQAILIKDIPLSAWVALLRDPNNIFGKSIRVTNEESALSVMQTFPDLELPVHLLPDGVRDVVKAVIPYIDDPIARLSVEEQYQKLHADQDEIHIKASGIADRWLAFELEMAESLHGGVATPYIRDFISEFHSSWGEATQRLLYANTFDNGELSMTRELAVKIEEVRTKILWIKSAIANNNTDVIDQMDKQIVSEILYAEQRIQQMVRDGYNMTEILVADNSNNYTVAVQEVKGGGGCPGEIMADIKTQESKSTGNDKQDSKQEKADKEEVLRCVTCPLCNKKGVDAKIQYFGAKKRITCNSCHQYKEYKK